MRIYVVSCLFPIFVQNHAINGKNMKKQWVHARNLQEETGGNGKLLNILVENGCLSNF